MKKRNNREHDYQTMGRKILCGKFAQRLRNNFAIGDQDNNLILYNVENIKPITVLNSQTSNVSSVTALTFTQSDDQIIVGSNRGSINVWDLNTLKISYCLKGHTVEVCSLYADKKSDNIIVSGSFDTNIKVWDLRSKNSLHLIKGHKMKVASLCTTNDSKMVISGGEDGIMQTFDMRVNKILFQYDIGSAVLSLDYQTSGYIAAGCLDRVARLYDINAPFKLLGQTKNDSMPITSVCFYKDDVLFTGGTDILKAWNISDDVYLTDNVETGSKGVLHMTVQEKIQQIAYSSGTLSYHKCFLSDVNFKGPYSFSSHSIQIQREKGINRPSSIPKQPIFYKDPIAQITNEKTKNVINKRNQSLAKEMAGVNGEINEVLSNVKRVSQQFSKRKNQALQLNELMQEDHSKFMKVMGVRAKAIQTVLDCWSKGNTRQVMVHLKNCDIYAATDVLQQILKPGRGQVSAQFGVIIAQKAKQMIKSKHVTIIKNGISYMLHIVSLFKDDMIRLKVFGSDKGVDLARQERLRRFDSLIQQYMEVYQSHRLKHLISKQDQTSKQAEQLQGQFISIFKKVLQKGDF